MSTTKQTTSNATQSNLYNPGSLLQYNQLQPQIGGALSDEINNPYNSMFFNTQLGMANQALGAQNSSAMSSNLQRLNAMGLNKNSALVNWGIRQNAMAGQSRGAQMYNNLLLSAAQMRQNALGMGMSYRPLQTGINSNSSQRQTTSGLGTWLPQVAALAMSPFMGGASLLRGPMSNMGGNFSGNQLPPMYMGPGAYSDNPGPAPVINAPMTYNPFLQ